MIKGIRKDLFKRGRSRTCKRCQKQERKRRQKQSVRDRNRN